MGFYRVILVTVSERILGSLVLDLVEVILLILGGKDSRESRVGSCSCTSEGEYCCCSTL